MTIPTRRLQAGRSWRHVLAWALVFVLLAAGAATLVFRGFARAVSDMGDFAVMYASTRVFDRGGDPYDAATIQEQWRQSNPGESSQKTLDLALYPPSTYLLLSPFGWFDWKTARWLVICVNVVAVVVLIAIMGGVEAKRLTQLQRACLAALILGFGPIHTAITKGQLVVVVAALFALAILAESRGAPLLGAVLIAGAGAVKPQMAIPVALLYVAQKRWKAVAVLVTVAAAILGLGVIRLSLAGIPWLHSMVDNLHLASQPGGVYDPAPSNPLSFQLINISPLLHSLTSNEGIIQSVIIVIGVAGAWLIWIRVRACATFDCHPAAFSAACVLGLVLIPHRYYDATLLVFALGWAFAMFSRVPPLWPWTAVAGCVLMAFPIPALLVSSGHRQPPGAVPQMFWDAAVLHQQSWILLALLITLIAQATPKTAART